MKIPVLLLALIALPGFARGQVAPSDDGTIAVFLDCNVCDGTYTRDEIKFVRYVRDRSDADIHLLITSESTGGGSKYVLNYIGRTDNAVGTDTLAIDFSTTDTSEERRDGLTRAIKLGLVRYLVRTPMMKNLDLVLLNEEELTETRSPADPWNSWLFEVGAGGEYDSEQSTDELSLSGDLGARRYTEDLKFRLSADGELQRRGFELADTSIVSRRRNGGVDTWFARSKGEHWSFGGSSSIRTSSFDNVTLEFDGAPAIEYSVFPYSEFTRREFRIGYRAGLRIHDYEEPTIYERTSEQLLFHELEATLETREPWGSTEFDLEIFQYLTDLDVARTDLYRVEISGELQLRIVRGLSLDAEAYVSWVHDQISLPLEEVSEEDILLGARRLPTNYEYGFELGLSYTFGSIYNNVSNPRFGF